MMKNWQPFVLGLGGVSQLGGVGGEDMDLPAVLLDVSISVMGER